MLKLWEQMLRRTWVLIRDVVFAGFGIWLIYRETVHPAKSAEETIALLGIALALTVPSAAEHIKAILPSSSGESAIASPSGEPGPGPGSPPSPPHGSPSPPTSSGAHGER